MDSDTLTVTGASYNEVIRMIFNTLGDRHITI